MTKKYTSKTSYVLLIFIFLIIFAPLFPVLQHGELDAAMTQKLTFMILIFAFVLHIFLSTIYTIDGGKLKIRSGIIPYRPVNISEIREISKTKSLWSSPAPSFDRIVIKYGQNRSVIVSPKDKVSFARDLSSINPNIVNNITED